MCSNSICGGFICHAVILQYKTPLNIYTSWKKEPPSPALCESLFMHSVKTEAVNAVMPGVGNFVTKKLLEKLCLARCQIAPSCFIKLNALLYNIDLYVKKSGSYFTAIGHWAAVIRNKDLTSIIHVHHAAPELTFQTEPMPLIGEPLAWAALFHIMFPLNCLLQPLICHG